MAKMAKKIKRNFKEGNTMKFGNAVKEGRTVKEDNTMKEDNTVSKDYTMDEIDIALEHMAKAMDEDFMCIGKEIAELYRTVCTACASLPNMCLRTELMEVHNSDDGLMVVFHRAAAQAGLRDKEDEPDEDGLDEDGYNDDDYGDHDDYDEEEDLLYDGD